MASHRDLLDTALRAAERAAGFIRGAARPDAGAWDRKARSDFVTDVDREAERLIAETLLDAVPGSEMLGEEATGAKVDGSGGTDGRDGRDAGGGSEPNLGRQDRRPPAVLWVVDPLDGTTNYLHGYPAYAVSIAAVADGTPVAAVVADVVRGLTYHAASGSGAWCGDRRLAVSTVADPSLALIGTGFPFKAPADARLDEYLAQFRRILLETSGIRRAGSAALDLAHVAEGRLDGFWEIGLAPWDFAAGVLLVREAGGVVTDFSGAPLAIQRGDVVAGSKAVHGWLIRRVGG